MASPMTSVYRQASELPGSRIQMTVPVFEAVPLADVFTTIQASAEREGAQVDCGIEDNTHTYIPITYGAAQMGRARLATITVRSPRLVSGNWDLKALVSAHASGKRARSARGFDAADYLDTDLGHCDHCSAAPRRVFVLEDRATGKRSQFGSQCMESATGITAQLATEIVCWFDTYLSAVNAESWSESVTCFGQWTVEFALRLAYLLTDGGAEFVPKRDLSRRATADRVADVFDGLCDGDREEILARAAQVDPEVIDSIIEFGKSFKPGTPYATKVRQVMQRTTLDPAPDLGLVVSVISAWFKATGGPARGLEADSSQLDSGEGYMGRVGEFLQNMGLTVEKVMLTQSRRGTDVTVVEMTDGQDREATYRVPGACEEFSEGDKIVGSGIVKSHTTVDGHKQTVLARFRTHQGRASGGTSAVA